MTHLVKGVDTATMTGVWFGGKNRRTHRRGGAESLRWGGRDPRVNHGGAISPATRTPRRGSRTTLSSDGASLWHRPFTLRGVQP
jgi:hypothetical protein